MELTNDYGSYSGNTLIGELGSRGNVPNSGFGGVKGVPYPSLTFIVEIDGQKYASSQWLAQQRSNPYKSQSTVAGAGLKISLNDAIDIGADNQGQTLEQQEEYAEVKVNKNLQTADDVLKHIAWLVDENTDALRTVTDYGAWGWVYDSAPGREVTSITDPVGNTYQIGVVYTGFTSTIAGNFVGKYNSDTDFRGNAPGLKFKASGFDGGIGGEAAMEQSTSVTSDIVVPVNDKDTNTLADTVGIINPNNPIIIDPIDFPIDFGDFDFGFGNINLGTPNLTMGNLNPVSSGFGNNNMTGLASLQSLANEGGLASAGLQQQYDSGDIGPMGAIYGG